MQPDENLANQVENIPVLSMLSNPKVGFCGAGVGTLSSADALPPHVPRFRLPVLAITTHVPNDALDCGIGDFSAGGGGFAGLSVISYPDCGICPPVASSPPLNANLNYWIPGVQVSPSNELNTHEPRSGPFNHQHQRANGPSPNVDQDFLQPHWSSFVPQEQPYQVTNKPFETAVPSTEFTIDRWTNGNVYHAPTGYDYTAGDMNNGQSIYMTGHGFGTNTFGAGDLIDSSGVTSLQQVPFQGSVIGSDYDTSLYPSNLSGNEMWNDVWVQGPSTQALPALQAMIDPTPTASQQTTINGFLCARVGCNKVFGRDADRIRHETTVHGANQGFCFCPITGCDKSLGFGMGYSRADKVKEHLWRKHANLGYVKGRM